MRFRTCFSALFLAFATLAMMSAATALETDTLPAGTSISVDNTSPVDGDQYLVPLGDTTATITDTGTAQVGGGAVPKDTSIVYVIDVSGSTNSSAGVDCDGDNIIDRRLRCEQVGALAVNTAAADPLSIVHDQAVVAFAAGANVRQPLTTNSAAVANAINSLSPGGATNYQAGVNAAQAALASSTQPNRIVIFLSDGQPTTGNLAAAPNFGPNTVVRAFAIGSPGVVSCSGPAGQDLNAVAAKGGAGSGCQQVSDPSQLGALVTQAVGSSLDSVEISVGGGPFAAIPAGDLDAALPIGPNFNTKTVNWSTAVSGLAPGFHQICARATGTDAGGTGDVEDCKTIQLLQIQVDGVGLEVTNELGEDDTHTVAVDVAGDIGGTPVTFEVTGVNGPDGTVVLTDADGKASFTYSSPQDPSGLGDDEITASIEVNGTTQTLTFIKHWVDTTPPEAACVESVNPNGRQTPGAPGNGGQGQNQDGFYEVGGTDDIWPDADLVVFVTDAGSGTVFGPFAVGDVIKYTEAAGATPEQKSIGGPNSAVAAHIIGNGDGVVTVVDGSGNLSAGADCLVPAPPK